jgi:hypothetical protein
MKVVNKILPGNIFRMPCNTEYFSYFNSKLNGSKTKLLEVNLKDDPFFNQNTISYENGPFPLCTSPCNPTPFTAFGTDDR